MTTRKQRRAVPRLESMEERMVPSAINLSPSATAQIHKLGHKLQRAATTSQNYLTSLIQNRTSHNTPSWTTHAVPKHHVNNGLFGIPWLKF
jgi:hypothetical protein